MSETAWTNQEGLLAEDKSNRWKFIIGGLVLASAIVFLVYNATQSTGQLYKTVDEYYASPGSYIGQDMRIAGWVIGDSIQFTQIDATTSRLEFDIVDDIDNPGQSLHIVAVNQPKPDLLQHNAQALVIGQTSGDGTFYAQDDGLLLKCPTRYEELEPQAAATN